MATRPKEENNEKKEFDNTQGGKPDSSSGGKAPKYLEAALRLSTSRPLGAPRTDNEFILFAGNYAGSQVEPGNVAVPGIMALDYAPTYGVSRDATSALNRAVFNEFNLIRSEISGNRNYEPCDHMIARMCIDSLRELYMYVRRIYAIVRGYSATNLYRPNAILTAMGLDPNSWISNAADLYQWLLTHQGALLPFPTAPIGTIHDRHATWDTYLFTDGEIESSQTYIINHKYFYSYEVVDEVKGLTIREFPATYDEFVTMWDTMYAALQGSSDIYTICADIRRAFKERVITDLPDTPVDAVVEYKKLDSALVSIMNATIVPMEGDTVTQMLKIVDNGVGGLETDMGFASVNYRENESSPYTLPAFLGHINMLEAEPAPQDIAAAVRFKPNVRVHREGNGIFFTQILSMGTEIITGASIVGFNSDGSVNKSGMCSCLAIDGSYHNAQAWRRLLQTTVQLSCFDWHPPVVMWNFTDASGTAYWGVDEDVQNYIPISRNNINSIHDAILLAEFGI